jgi:hypothetical protein
MIILYKVLLRFKSPFPTDLPVEVIVAIDGKDMDEMLIRQDELYEEEGHVSMGPISNTEEKWRKQRYRFATLDTSAFTIRFQGVDCELMMIQARMFPKKRWKRRSRNF